MTKYRIESTVACFVTWRYEVEAESEEHAKQLYRDGNAGDCGEPMIGDAIEYVQPVDDLRVGKIS